MGLQGVNFSAFLFPKHLPFTLTFESSLCRVQNSSWHFPGALKLSHCGLLAWFPFLPSFLCVRHAFRPLSLLPCVFLSPVLPALRCTHGDCRTAPPLSTGAPPLPSPQPSACSLLPWVCFRATCRFPRAVFCRVTDVGRFDCHALVSSLCSSCFQFGEFPWVCECLVLVGRKCLTVISPNVFSVPSLRSYGAPVT